MCVCVCVCEGGLVKGGDRGQRNTYMPEEIVLCCTCES